MKSVLSSSLLAVVLLFGWHSSSFGQSGTPPSGYCGGTTTNGVLGQNFAIRAVLMNDIFTPQNLFNDNYVNWDGAGAPYGPATVVAGQQMHISVQDGSTTYPHYLQAWIDYDQDGDFEASEKLNSQFFPSGTGNVAAMYFNVPQTATLGNTFLRVRNLYNTDQTNGCGTAAYGQTYDYPVTIVGPLSTLSTPLVFDGGNVVQQDADLVHITNVSLGSINNSSTGYGTNAGLYNYSNYTWIAPTDITAGSNQTLTVSKSAYDGTLAAWIDWNNDGDFLDANEEIGMAHYPSTNTATFNFTAPAGLGHNTQSTMRVRVVYDNVTSTLTPTNTTWGSANSNNNNETEDYRVNFVNPSVCFTPNVTAQANATATTYNLCALGEDVDLTGNATGTGGNCTGSFAYSWYNGTNYWNGTAFASATPVFDAGYEDVTATNVTANTTFTVEVQCSDDATCSSTSSVDVVYDASAVITHPSGNTTTSVTACSGTYYDPGNTGNYPLNVNSTLTIYPCNSTDKVELDFTTFAIEAYDGQIWDYLNIYDGNSTGAPLIGQYYGAAIDGTPNNVPGTITSTAADGSLTLRFYSDGFVTRTGWIADVSCISPATLVCQEVDNPAIAIGNPANGTNHHLNLTWDALTGATEYDVEVSTTGSFTGTPTATVATNSYDFDAGDNPNTEYYFQVRASDGTTDCDWTDFGSLYTAADNPALPTVNNATGTTLDVTLEPESPVVNPAITTYSIKENNSGLFVQANGSLGATEVFQTKAVWNTITVTGLSSNTEYCFLATARNNDGDTRGGGATVQTTQTFDGSGDLNTAAGSGPTNVFWSPSSCSTGGMAWNGSNGCGGGSVGFSGSFNSFYGCFLRTPAQNCTGLSSVTMTFDLSNSYFAAQPNDRVYFNMWAPTAGNPGGTYIDATTVNGTPADELLFSSVRNCESVTVEFDLSTVTDKSAILFYINADCAYNNSNVFYVWLDNINIQETAPTACATTLTTPQPDLIVETITPDVLSLCGTGTVDYDVEITNDGTQAIAPGTNFTVSAHVGSLACGGGVTATQTVTSGLGIGASTTLTFSLALSGSGDVSFNVDNGTAIAETDESNNCGSDNSVAVGSGLGGTYTIDATQATAGTNFNSFADAASALNAQGVCSAVVFNVRTDTYDESFTLTDVAGVSATNTITYQSQSGNPADAVIASSAFSDVVVLHNTDYVTFKDMTISYAGGSSYVPLELQDDADNVTVTNCVFTTTSTSTSTTSNALIYASESSASLLIDDLLVENSTFTGGSRGISFLSGSAESDGVIVRGNTFDGQLTDGLYIDDATAVQVTGNTITSSASSGTSYVGVEVDNSSGGVTVAGNTVTGNNIKKGIRLSGSDATAGSPNRIYNNFVAIGGTYNQVRGIELSSSDHTDVLFNSVNIFTSSNTLGTTGLYLTSTFVDGSVDILNNIFAVSSGLSAHITVYLASTNNRVDIGTIDYNNYYAPSSASVGYSSGDQTLAQWQTLLSDDGNSLSIDPQFVSSTDLHINAAALGGAGTAVGGITVDIDSDVRATPPAIGADEVTSCTQGLWAGTINTSWSTAGNWDCNSVPDINTDVTIPTSPSGGNFPVVDITNAECASLTIASSATLTVSANNAITADDDVINNGNVYVENGGNFIQTENGLGHSGSGQFIVSRVGNSSGGFNAWSTPVQGGSLPGSNGYSYNSSAGTNSNADDNNPDPDPGWVSHSGPMSAGRGYFSTNGGTATFTGQANNADINPNITSSPEPLTSTDAPTFFNLIGNPYPSSIDANQFINDNQGRIDGALYYWSDENVGSPGYSQDDYATYNLAGVIPISTTNSGQPGGGGVTPVASIPACQGFFVNCISSGSVDFNNGQRGGDNSQFFRMAEVSDAQRLWLSINNSAEETFNQVLVGFDENATDEKDWGVDAYKIRGNQSISIGAEQDGETYAIATYESISQNGKVIPLMTYVENAGLYTFVADSMEGFDTYNVYLEDLANGALYPLQQGDSYSFSMTDADEFGRFQLWFSPLVVTGLEERKNAVDLYAHRSTIVVQTKNKEDLKGTMQVLDMSGRILLNEHIVLAGGVARFQVAGIATGIYAVSFVSENGKFNVSEKVTLGQ